MVGGNNKVVATLRADGKVYPEGFIGQLANTLMNYKIRTEAEMANKTLNTLGLKTVVDLGKQLLQYARDSDLKGVRNMISRGAPFTSDWLGMSALHFAAMNNQYEICDALLKGGINKDSRTKVDRTPLHFACYAGNERIVELLLFKNCVVNCIDMLRMTPLHWAVEKRRKKIVRLLLNHHADVTILSKFGRTPIALAVMTEQVDLLGELEAAKKKQFSRLICDEQEKETSDAVNSIISGMKSETTEEPDAQFNIDSNGSANGSQLHGKAHDDYATSARANFNCIKETGVLDDTAINILKSHGISMMQDDDEDTSKDMLTTVLRNGRQLVLSEGGKLSLNESKRNTDTTNGVSSSSSIGGGGVMNSKQVIVPVGNQITPTNKAHTSVISKAKDGIQPVTTLGKNKNIRIISLNDFKKLYSSTELKNIPKLPSPLTNSPRIASQTKSDDNSGSTTKSVERKVFIGGNGLLQSRQLKAPLTESVNDCSKSNIIHKENQSLDIIEIEPTDSEAELTEQTEQLVSGGGSGNTDSVRSPQIMPTVSRRMEHMPPGQPVALRTRTVPYSLTGRSTHASELKTSPSLIPLLSLPEICRQLYELRKQNEELRRKCDIAQKDNEELRQGLKHLEDLLLVERTDV